MLVGNAGQALAEVSLRWGGSFISLLNVLWEADHDIAHRTTMFDRYVIRFLSYPFRLKGTNGASIPTAYSSVRHSEDMGLSHLRVPSEPSPDISTSTTLDGHVLLSRQVPTPPPYPKDKTGMVGIPCAVEKDEPRPKPPPADEDGQAYGPGDPDKWADSMLNVDERHSRIARIIDWTECRGRLHLLWMKWIGSQGFRPSEYALSD